MLNLMKSIWRSWKRAVHGINGAISVVLMSIAYVLAVTPVALFMKLFRGDPLDRGESDRSLATFGKPARFRVEDIRSAQRPW